MPLPPARTPMLYGKPLYRDGVTSSIAEVCYASKHRVGIHNSEATMQQDCNADSVAFSRTLAGSKLIAALDSAQNATSLARCHHAKLLFRRRRYHHHHLLLWRRRSPGLPWCRPELMDSCYTAIASRSYFPVALHVKLPSIIASDHAEWKETLDVMFQQ